MVIIDRDHEGLLLLEVKEQVKWSKESTVFDCSPDDPRANGQRGLSQRGKRLEFVKDLHPSNIVYQVY